MKIIKVLYLLLALISLNLIHAQRGVRIGYVDMEYILENVEEYKMANELLEKKVQKWKLEIEAQQGAIAQMREDLSAEKILLTKELVQEREDEINALEQQVMEYQQDRFGPAGDLVMQRSQLVKPLQDQVFNAVQELAATKQYDFIFDKSADVVMLYSDKRFDISDQILRSIDIGRKRDQRAGKSNEILDAYQEIDPDKKLIDDEYEQKKADRAKTIEEKRAAKLKEIEERKKAYEERRRKMMEEREAKKKAKEGEKEIDTTTTNNKENGEEN